MLLDVWRFGKSVDVLYEIALRCYELGRIATQGRARHALNRFASHAF